jgi:hypothetical protein
MWQWWRTSEGYCTLCALAVIAVFLYMAFSIEPRLSPTPRQNQQDRDVGATYSESNDSAHCDDSLKALWRCATKDPIA